MRFTFPFCYTPRPEIVEAARRMTARIDADPALRAIFAEGKMLGVLMVEDPASSPASAFTSSPASATTSSTAPTGDLPAPVIASSQAPTGDLPAQEMADQVGHDDSQVGHAASSPAPTGDLPAHQMAGQAGHDESQVGHAASSPASAVASSTAPTGDLPAHQMADQVGHDEKRGWIGHDGSHPGVRFLYAFSGLAGGRNRIEGFVPPIYDLLDPDGHFKQEEAAIVALTAKIRALEMADQVGHDEKRGWAGHDESQAGHIASSPAPAIASSPAPDTASSPAPTGDLPAHQMADQVGHDEKRGWVGHDESQVGHDDNGPTASSPAPAIPSSPAPTGDLLAHQMADQVGHDEKRGWVGHDESQVGHDASSPAPTTTSSPAPAIPSSPAPTGDLPALLQAMKQERRERSIALQEWIFDAFIVHNARGESLSIAEVFARRGLVPPGGTGECAAPKLLEYAYRHGLRPLAMGEFWYGASPAGELRRPGSFYPSCTGKCGPLLDFMLEGLDVEPSPFLAVPKGWKGKTGAPYIPILYEDDAILVIDKPSGLLSVPGRINPVSVVSLLNGEHGPLYPCHRLDMDTSGLMVYAKTPEDQAELQAQFAARSVRKTYRARLIAERSAVAEGVQMADQVGHDASSPAPTGDLHAQEMADQVGHDEKQGDVGHDGSQGGTKASSPAPDTASSPAPTITSSPAPTGDLHALHPGTHGWIDLPIAPDWYDRPRQKVDPRHGKQALTEYEILAVLPDGSLDVRFTPHTGRTHQLRVHAAHPEGLGRPILGDRLYGGHADAPAGVLHLRADSLSFLHPRTGAPLRFTL